MVVLSFHGGSDGKESACSVGDSGVIPGSGRCLGEGTGNPLQYSCLENPMDTGAEQARVHGVAKSQILLSNSHTLCGVFFVFLKSSVVVLYYLDLVKLKLCLRIPFPG